MQKAVEKKRKLCIVFIDIKKAYDSFKRNFEIHIKGERITNVYMNLIEDMFEEVKKEKNLCIETKGLISE